MRYLLKTPSGELIQLHPNTWEWLNARPEILSDGTKLIIVDPQK